MPDNPASNPLQVPTASCSVCWQDFGHLLELEQHIRTCHPDRIGTEEEFFARRDAA
jgi:hypothetical protein